MVLNDNFPTRISLDDYGYDLSSERIARYPLPNRVDSKLLVWQSPGKISSSTYAQISRFLPQPGLLVFNNSRVVEARILFTKASGGQIEIFCLEPAAIYSSIPSGMQQTGKVLWNCLIGGASKWKRGQTLAKQIGDIRLEADFIEKRKEDFIVEFSWSPVHLSFAEILHQAGSIPLPPYLKRPAESLDTERYQNVYAREAGSVAAPTAGLHFSDSLLESLAEKKIQQLYLTLHVGAGTFMPVKVDNMADHHMHEEFIEVTATAVKQLLEQLNKTVIAVGTTSLRTLETLYWLGLKIYQRENIPASELQLEQRYPYQPLPKIKAAAALTCLLEWIEKQPEKKLISKTQLFIVPGYSFKIVRGLITNFHQPHSTLLLLVAAFIGPEWKSVYRFALDNGYRFLSYGDGCLFLPD